MPDGLYRVVKRLPKVGTMCAPILRRKIDYWVTEAVKVSD